MPEIGTSGLMSGERKRSQGEEWGTGNWRKPSATATPYRLNATASFLDSTKPALSKCSIAKMRSQQRMPHNRLRPQRMIVLRTIPRLLRLA